MTLRRPGDGGDRRRVPQALRDHRPDGPAGAHVEVLDASDPAAALLDAAALLTVAQRAGFRPRQPRPGAAWPSRDGRPTDAAARAVRARRAGAAADRARAAGARVRRRRQRAAGRPAHSGQRRGLRGVGAAAARPARRGGPHGRPPAGGGGRARRPGPLAGGASARLAADRRCGRRCRRRSAQDGAATRRRAVRSSDPEVWRTGSRSERHAYLAAQRERDPKAGRELLAADWAQQTGDERAALLAVLVRGLSADDEEFLDAALDDRADAVRAVARRLLTLLPGSRFSQRATERAARRAPAGAPRTRASAGGERARRPRRRRGQGRDRRPPAVAVHRPRRLAAHPAHRRRPAGRLDARCSACRPATSWRSRSRPNRGLDVHAGWRLAAVDQRNRRVGRGPARGRRSGRRRTGRRPPGRTDQRLAAVLPPDRRAARAAALLAEHQPERGAGGRPTRDRRGRRRPGPVARRPGRRRGHHPWPGGRRWRCCPGCRGGCLTWRPGACPPPAAATTPPS